MYRILAKEKLNSTVTRMEIEAPAVAKKAKAGQFVILRAEEDGERIPLTVADYNREKGSVTVIYQIVGGTTRKLDALNVNGFVPDFVGPLGRPTETEDLKKVAVVGGGVGCAIAYPVAKALFNNGAVVHSVAGFRSSDLVILKEEFKQVSEKFLLMTDDGSDGEKGLVTSALKKLIDEGNVYDEVIVIGPLVMMKAVSELTKEYGIKTVASMNPIMIDGTGMCGGCRLTVGNEIKFACVDGPEFDAHLVDFDEAISRSMMYREFESKEREKTCNLFSKEGV